MLYICYNEHCQTHHACDCGSRCCNGFKSPMHIKVISDVILEYSDDEGESWYEGEVDGKEIRNLVYFNECPECRCQVEC